MNTNKNVDRIALEQWMANARCYADFQLDVDGNYENIKTFWAWKGWEAAQLHYTAGDFDLPEIEQEQLSAQFHH